MFICPYYSILTQQWSSSMSSLYSLPCSHHPCPWACWPRRRRQQTYPPSLNRTKTHRIYKSIVDIGYVMYLYLYSLQAGFSPAQFASFSSVLVMLQHLTGLLHLVFIQWLYLRFYIAILLVFASWAVQWNGCSESMQNKQIKKYLWNILNKLCR